MSGRTFAVALHDLRMTLADRGAVLWMFILPVVFATFFGLVIGGGSDPASARASLTLVDHDRGVVARSLVTALAGEGIEIDERSHDEVVRSDDVVRTLVIPAGFSDGVLAGRQQTLRLEKQPGSSDEAALVIQARTLAAMATVMARVVEAAEDAPPGGPVSADDFEAAGADDDLVRVATSFAGRARVVPGGFAQSIPGMGVMFVMLVALTYGAAAVSAERQGGQLRRLVTSPLSRLEIVAGKIGGRFVVAALQITALVAVGFAASRVVAIDIGERPAAVWAVLLLFGLVVAPLGVAVGAWVRDPDRAASVGVMTTMAMAALGGCWWPIEVVSGPLKTAALFLPSGWAMRILHGLISFGHGLGEMVPDLLVLAGFGVLFAMFAARSLRID